MSAKELGQVSDLSPYKSIIINPSMDQTSITPYRTADIAPIKPKHGLITVAPPIKHKHKSPPGFFKRMWLGGCGRPIGEGSVWRCKCGQVFEFQFKYERYAWWPAKSSTWVDAGGEE